MARLALAVIFVLLIFGASGTHDDPFLVYNTELVSLAWDTQAQDAQVTGIEIEVMDEAGTPVLTQSVPKADWIVDATSNRIRVRVYVQELANGLYQMRGRFYDESLNTSPWSATIWTRKSWVTYQPPGGCRFLP
jgi:hypothetical protein